MRRESALKCTPPAAGQRYYCHVKELLTHYTSYRDTFRLLIQHLSQATGRKPSDLTLDDLQAKAIMRFLDGIERDRGNSVQTRNARLAAIRSFFRLVTLREPARLDLAAQVLAIPTKRADRRLIGYLSAITPCC